MLVNRPYRHLRDRSNCLEGATVKLSHINADCLSAGRAAQGNREVA